MLLSCAIEGGDPEVVELVQNLGAEGAWAKIVEGVLGEPVVQRAAQLRVEVFERLAEAAAAALFVVPGDDWPDGLDDLRHAEPHSAARR
jgi:DNA processing protein